MIASDAAVWTIAKRRAVRRTLSPLLCASAMRLRFQCTYGFSAQNQATSVCSGERTVLAAPPKSRVSAKSRA